MNSIDHIDVRFSQNANTRVCIRRNGQGPIVLFLHGWLCSGKFWYPVAAQLSTSYQTIAIDLPGFGQSPPIAQDHISIATYTTLVKTLILDLIRSDEIYAIVADSMGAIIAIDLIAEYGLKTKRLFLSGCPALGLPRPFKIPGAGRLLNIGLRVLRGLPPWLSSPLLRGLSILTIKNPLKVDPILVRDVLRADPVTAGLLLNDMIKLKRHIQPTGNFPKTAVVRGQRDLYAPRKSSQRLARLLKADYFEIPNSGHVPVMENRAVYMKLLSDFLDIS